MKSFRWSRSNVSMSSPVHPTSCGRRFPELLSGLWHDLLPLSAGPSAAGCRHESPPTLPSAAATGLEHWSLQMLWSGHGIGGKSRQPCRDCRELLAGYSCRVLPCAVSCGLLQSIWRTCRTTPGKDSGPHPRSFPLGSAIALPIADVTYAARRGMSRAAVVPWLSAISMACCLIFPEGFRCIHVSIMIRYAHETCPGCSLLSDRCRHRTGS